MKRHFVNSTAADSPVMSFLTVLYQWDVCYRTKLILGTDILLC